MFWTSCTLTKLCCPAVCRRCFLLNRRTIDFVTLLSAGQGSIWEFKDCNCVFWHFLARYLGYIFFNSHRHLRWWAPNVDWTALDLKFFQFASLTQNGVPKDLDTNIRLLRSLLQQSMIPWSSSPSRGRCCVFPCVPTVGGRRQRRLSGVVGCTTSPE